MEEVTLARTGPWLLKPIRAVERGRCHSNGGLARSLNSSDLNPKSRTEMFWRPSTRALWDSPRHAMARAFDSERTAARVRH